MRYLFLLWGLGVSLVGSDGGQTAGEVSFADVFGAEECEEQFNLALKLHVPGAWETKAQARVLFHWQEDQSGYALLLDADSLKLLKFKHGSATVLSPEVDFQPGRAAPLSLTIKRRPWRIGVIVNGVLRFTAYDDEFPAGGHWGYGVAGSGLEFQDPLYQPTEPVYFTDDFMRTPESEGAWTRVLGDWSYSGLPTPRPDPNKSANPFAYLGRGEKALATAGYWFWDDYAWEVSARPMGPGALGLVAYYQDPENYLLFRWHSATGGGERQLVKVTDGQPTLLAQADGGFESDQWYRLGLRVFEQLIEATLDGQLVLRAEAPLWGQGPAGLYAEGLPAAYFDDAKAEAWEVLEDDFSQSNPGRWHNVGSRWATQSLPGRESETSGALGVRIRLDNSGGDLGGKTIAGRSEWQNYVVSADIKPEGQGGVGLCFYYQDEGNHFLLRWGGDSEKLAYRNLCQLISVVQGEKMVLGQLRGGYNPGQWYRFRCEVDHSYIRAFVNDRLLFERLDWRLPGGKVGLYGHEAKGTLYDNVQVRFLPPLEKYVEFTAQFTREDTMKEWATELADWDPPAEGRSVYWHRGHFYGVPTLDLWVEGVAQEHRATTLILSGDGQNEQSGYSLTITTGPGEERIYGQIARAGRFVTRAMAFDVPPQSTPWVRFVQRGRYLVGYANGVCFVGYREDYDLLQGHRLGVRVAGGALNPNAVYARSANHYDTTFTTAPIDWHIQKGVWETTNRWRCAPDWSWFGGTKHLTPVIWSKRDYAGDLILEFYAAIQMDLDRFPHYSHPSDLNATICGNGCDLSSGYSFLFAGHHNTGSYLYRNGQLVAQNTALEARFDRPHTLGGLNRFHRHWFRLRVEKIGPQVRFSVDGHPLLQYTDPEPLPGGKVALWSVHNGVMIARTRLWFEREAAPVPFPDLAALQARADVGQAVRPGLVNDFEQGLGAWQPARKDEPLLLSLDTSTRARGQRSLRITNLFSGGEFGVRAIAEPFDPTLYPVLSFAYRLPPTVRVNIHARVQDTWHTLFFAGPKELPEGDRLLGAIPEVAADNQWHTARFDLRAALQRLYPDQNVLVQELIWANRSPNLYLYAGLEGNPFGTTYYLDDFQLGKGN